MNDLSQLTDLQKAMLALRNDPVLFVKEILGAEPYPWQIEFLYDIRDNPQNAVRSGNGVGKTTALAWTTLWFIATHNPVFVVCTAPSEDQLKDGIWKEIGSWHRKMPAWLRDEIVITDLGIHLKSNPADVRGKGRTTKSENTEALAGIHSDTMVFIVDEASGVQESVFEVAIGAMSTPGARMIIIGNPTRTQGVFHRAFHRNREHWHLRRVSAFENPRGGKKYATDIANQYGKDSNIYRVRVLGEFPLSDDDTLIPLNWLEDSVKRDVAVIDTAPIYWGLDIARLGSDRCALSKRKGNHLLEPPKTWRDVETSQTVGMVLNEYNDALTHGMQPQEIMVDSIGMGAAVIDRMKEVGLPAVGVNVSETPSVKGKYNRLRDELWYKGREWFEGRDVCIPEGCDDLISELSAPSYKIVDSNGKIKVESKDDMKKRTKKSPDIADSFLLTLIYQNNNPSFDKDIVQNTGWIT